jgi:hypothetical protein
MTQHHRHAMGIIAQRIVQASKSRDARKDGDENIESDMV